MEATGATKASMDIGRIRLSQSGRRLRTSASVALKRIRRHLKEEMVDDPPAKVKSRRPRRIRARMASRRIREILKVETALRKLMKKPLGASIQLPSYFEDIAKVFDQSNQSFHSLFDTDRLCQYQETTVNPKQFLDGLTCGHCHLKVFKNSNTSSVTCQCLQLGHYACFAKSESKNDSRAFAYQKRLDQTFEGNFAAEENDLMTFEFGSESKMFFMENVKVVQPDLIKTEE